jgi:hypothetical protein
VRSSSPLRPLLALALACAGEAASGCDLVLDIDRLDRGAGADAGADAAPPTVEILASGQCNPGDLAVAGDFVYWTTTSSEATPSCSAPESNSIRRVALDGAGEPTGVVTEMLDGKTNTVRPWGLQVLGDGVYWLGNERTVCTAKTTGVGQSCTPVAIPSPFAPSCHGQAIAGAGNELYFHGGACPSAGEIERYNVESQVADTTGLSVSGDFVGALAVASGWVAWIDIAKSCGEDPDDRRLNVAWPKMGSWSSCSSGFLTPHVIDVVVDSDRLYWLDPDAEGTTSLYALALSTKLTPSAVPVRLVRGFTGARSLALDERNVYITTGDRGGSVLYIARDTAPDRTVNDVGVLAHHRGMPYAITASPDLPWIYWLVTGSAGSVERARKPGG